MMSGLDKIIFGLQTMPSMAKNGLKEHTRMENKSNMIEGRAWVKGKGVKVGGGGGGGGERGGGKFVQGLFGLDLARHLATLQREKNENPDAIYRRICEHLDRFFMMRLDETHTLDRVGQEPVFIVAGRFTAEGKLNAMIPIGPYDQGRWNLLADIFIEAYNVTLEMPELERPYALQERAIRNIENMSGGGVIADSMLLAWGRIMTCCFVSFEQRGEFEWGSAGRFALPNFRWRKPPGLGVFNIIGRISPDRRVCDLWFEVNRPVSDMLLVVDFLSKLKKSFGMQETFFPNPTSFSPWALSRKSMIDSSNWEVIQSFINFSPLLQFRDELGRMIQDHIPGVALLTWLMYKQKTIGHGVQPHVAIFVKEHPHTPRLMDFIPVQLDPFIRESADLYGFTRYIKKFNEDIYNYTYDRQSGSSVLSGWENGNRWMRQGDLRETGKGGMGISIVPDAEVISPPMLDHLFAQGFISIGNVGLSSRNESGNMQVGSVTIRSPQGQAKNLLSALDSAVRSMQC